VGVLDSRAICRSVHVRAVDLGPCVWPAPGCSFLVDGHFLDLGTTLRQTTIFRSRIYSLPAVLLLLQGFDETRQYLEDVVDHADVGDVKDGASLSELIAMTVPASWMPTVNWKAPLTPQTTASSGV